MKKQSHILWLISVLIAFLFLMGCDKKNNENIGMIEGFVEAEEVVEEADEVVEEEEREPEEEFEYEMAKSAGLLAESSEMESLLGVGGASPDRGMRGYGVGASRRAIQPQRLDEKEFKSFSPNIFKNTLDSPFSTFGADVDTASYSILRRFVLNHQCPSNKLLRTEELINYFKYDYPAPGEGEPFSVTTELVKTPWNSDTQLLLVGMQSPKLKETPRSNIVFLIDISGSMYDSDKLPLLKQSIIASLPSFTENDRISIVVYASTERVVLSGANPVTDKTKIISALESLMANGSTNGERGLEMAYEQAAKYFIPGGNNRIIMGTDGDLNVGISSENELKAFVEKKRNQGIFLSILGFGFDNLKDNRMETLADNGNGSYHYIDTINEAIRVLVEDRESTLFTSAKDVKFQVEFNPTKVKGYRLIGYETRKLNTEDFKNDKKDGGEIGANQQMTALYEIIPIDSPVEVPEVSSAYQKKEIIPSDDLATIAVRYKKPDEDKSSELKYQVSSQVSEKLSENVRFAAAVTELGMILNGSEYKGNTSYQSALELLVSLNSIKSDVYKKEFFQMVTELSSRNCKNKIESKTTINLAEPTVIGLMDKRVVQKVVRQHVGELRSCYEREQQQIRDLSGNIVAQWVVNTKGEVENVEIKSSTMNNENVENCIKNTIKFWRFPVPRGDGVVAIEYPFEFSN